jgi:MFS family permease
MTNGVVMLSGKNALLIYSGKAVSAFGSKIYSFALSFYLLNSTGSNLQFSIALAVNYLPPIILAPIAGILNDRIKKKHTIILCDVVSALAALIPIAAKMSALSIYVTNFLLSCISVFFTNAIDALIPSIAEEWDVNALKRVTSIMQMITSISSITAPLFGGMLLASIEVYDVVLLNSISFILSALSECFINVGKTCEKAKAAAIAEIFEAIQYVHHAKSIKCITIFECILNFCIPFGVTSLLPYIIINNWKLPSSMLGIFNSMMAIGAVIGSSLFLYRLKKKFSLYKLSGIISIILFLDALIIYIDNNFIIMYLFILLCINQLIFGIIVANINIMILSVKLQTTPKNIIAKILGLTHSTSMLMVPAALILSGYLCSKLATHVMPLFSAIIIAISIIVFRKIGKEVNFMEPQVQNVEKESESWKMTVKEFEVSGCSVNAD